jgi:lipid A disaccharide synthetase
MLRALKRLRLHARLSKRFLQNPAHGLIIIDNPDG